MKRPVAIDHTHEPATTTYDGFLSKLDKAKIDELYTNGEIDTLLGNKSDIGHTHDERYYTESEITSLLSGKQNTLVSGTNIKTINGSSVLGSGDLAVTAVTDWTQVFDDSGTYRGYKAKSGSASGYMRTPSEGLLPYQSSASGSGYVGTPSWPFSNIYGINIYQDGDKVLAQAARGGSTIGGGYYIKLSDGTIIQFARITFSSASNTAMGGGGGYKSANQTWTFPIAFTSADSYSISVTPEGIYQIGASVQSRSATVLTYCTHTVSSDATSRSRTVHILAIGR